MQVVYEPWLVLLSIVMAIQGAYVGFTLASQLGDAVGVRRRVLLAGAAFSLAVAIWTMHFVGMLAARIPFPIDYLVFPTLLSLLVCVLVVGVAVFAISSGPFSLPRLFLSACLMGGGIFTHALHRHDRIACERAYGARAVFCHGELDHRHRRVRFGALACDGREVRRPPLILSSVAFGIAVSGMHYTAMAGMKLFPHAGDIECAGAFDRSAGNRRRSSGFLCVRHIPAGPRAGPHAGRILLVKIAPEPALTLQVTDANGVPVQPVKSRDGETQFGRGTYAPLGGAGGPPPRIAHHLPVERDGATQFIAVEDVVAIHANAHYTYVFNGTLKLFCPLAIGEVESRLDKNRFIRVHRSHIINIDRVIGHRRNGDSEMVELTASDHYSVPVSRSRIGWLKSRINARAG